MSRRLRHRLAGSLRQQQRGGWHECTAVLRLPQTLTGSAPVWSPGPQDVEALSATVWASHSDGDTQLRFHPAAAAHLTDPLQAHALRRLAPGRA